MMLGQMFRIKYLGVVTVNGIEIRVCALESEVKEIKGTCKDISDRLIRMEETLKNSKDTTVDFKTYNQAIMEMSGSVKLLTEKVSEVLVKLDKQDTKLEAQDNKIVCIIVTGKQIGRAHV